MASKLTAGGALLPSVVRAARQQATFTKPGYSTASPAVRSSHHNFITSRFAKPGRKATMSIFTSTAAATAERTPYEFTVKDIDGKDIDLGKYKGKVVLVVNVASQCGFTPQYKELGELYDTYSSKGFVILGFPCNQFGGQEPADNSKIKEFAKARGANFPMMAKVDVNGSKAEPFYTFLKSKQGGILVSDVKWNFTKFLINKQGEVVKRYGSATTPKSIEEDIKNLL